jgi:hypothetical protein
MRLTASERGHLAAYASLVVDCHGNVVDILVTSAAGEGVFGDLPMIRIIRARGDERTRVAVR